MIDEGAVLGKLVGAVFGAADRQQRENDVLREILREMGITDAELDAKVQAQLASSPYALNSHQQLMQQAHEAALGLIALSDPARVLRELEIKGMKQ